MKFGLLLVSLLTACSHTPVSKTPELGDPRAALERICSLGTDHHSAKGSLQLKTESPDVTGQFAANVDVKSADALVLEVTNLLGGTEAIVRVSGRRYEIEVPSQKNRAHEKGAETWGGIPLRWGPLLFLGQVPCAEVGLRKDSTVHWDAEGKLVVEAPAGLASDPERYTYVVSSSGARPESVRWERLGPVPRTVDFHFDGDLKWDAKSPSGQVKIRWKSRQLD